MNPTLQRILFSPKKYIPIRHTAGNFDFSITSGQDGIGGIDMGKFTPATTLITEGKLAYNSLTKAYSISKEALAKGEEVLMSHAEFVGGMKNIKGVPVTITPDGKQPVFPDIDKETIDIKGGIYGTEN